MDISPNENQWVFIICLGVVHTALLHFLTYSAVQKIPLNNIAILSFIYPTSTIIIDYLFFDHLLTSYQIIGGILILIGVLGIELHWNVFRTTH